MPRHALDGTSRRGRLVAPQLCSELCPVWGQSRAWGCSQTPRPVRRPLGALPMPCWAPQDPVDLLVVLGKELCPQPVGLIVLPRAGTLRLGRAVGAQGLAPRFWRLGFALLLWVLRERVMG